MNSNSFVFADNSEGAPERRPDELSQRLKTLGFQDQPEGLRRVERFFSEMNLNRSDRAFSSLVDCLTKAVLVLALLDDNSFCKFDYPQLAQHAEEAHGVVHNVLTWVVAHFDSISDLLHSDNRNGISRHDLIVIRNLFRGLDYAHHNFADIAVDDTATALHDNDILMYVWSCGNSLDGDVRRGLLQLASFLQGAQLSNSN